MTRDGKFLIMPNGIIEIEKLEAAAKSLTHSQSSKESSNQEIPKSEKPKVELFVMTYCPFGMQSEKGIIPIFELFEEKIDSKIRFVHYFMHGKNEEEETYRQVCIREEQQSKYIDYLKCFLDAGESEKCIEKVNINKVKLDSCIKGRAQQYYSEDAELSKKYGVRGSPTLVINGVIVQSGRSQAAYLLTICSTFVSPPEECEESVSNITPSPGFGYRTASSSSGSCG